VTRTSLVSSGEIALATTTNWEKIWSERFPKGQAVKRERE